MEWWNPLLGVAMAFAPISAMANDVDVPTPGEGAEIAAGMFAHGFRQPFQEPPPVGFRIYEGEEERGTTDLQVLYRTAPIAKAFNARLTARLQVNTNSRTNFASVGVEWRRHILNGRAYGQIGVGLTIHDGYRYTPDPFSPGLSSAEAQRRYEIYWRRTAFGSRVLFNPNFSVGVNLNDRWAIEAAYEHFSHKQVFSEQNPGIETAGLRLVYKLGRR